MTTFKKLLTAALAVAALATASIATSGDALAKGGHGGGMRSGFSGGAKFVASRHLGHRWHRHRHWHFGYDSCWRYTSVGWVNICLLPR